MNHSAHTNKNRLKFARESFSARLLSDPQFEECIAITNIIGREIRRSGKFKDKLGDYAYALARTEKFDAGKAESILRDLFKERTGQTMNQMREALIKEEEALGDDQHQKSYQAACDIGQIMEEGKMVSFHRALAAQAQELARGFGITDVAAKRMMALAFKNAEGSDLYEWGKKLDEKVFRPQIDKEVKKRSQTQLKLTGSKPATLQTRNGPM